MLKSTQGLGLRNPPVKCQSLCLKRCLFPQFIHRLYNPVIFTLVNIYFFITQETPCESKHLVCQPLLADK